MSTGQDTGPEVQQCEGKRAFRTSGEAKSRVRQRIDQGADPSAVVAYPCARCGRWHVGHPSQANRVEQTASTSGDVSEADR